MWRRLVLFWGVIGAGLAGGVASLQWLGPPAAVTSRPHEENRNSTVLIPDSKTVSELPSRPVEPGTGHAVESAVTSASEPPGAALLVGAVRGRPGRTGPIPVPPPNSALLDPAKSPAEGRLPRIASDGRTAGQVYAGAFAPMAGRPHIAVILVGFGLNTMTDDAAMRDLPAGVSFSVSPYAAIQPATLQAARDGGHELLLSIPMEPQGFPLNDPGDHALLSTATPEENRANLRWVLGRVAGYAGATGALGPGLNGERFTQITEQMDDMLSELAARGLFYVDPRVSDSDADDSPALARAPLPAVWSRAIDRVIDDPPSRAGIDASLAELEHIASDRGVAVGLVGIATPVLLGRLKVWSRGLAERGFDLAPASAVMQPPAARLGREYHAVNTP